MKTLKYEEVYRNEYRDLAEARAHIGALLERVYNQKRLHSALGERRTVSYRLSQPRGPPHVNLASLRLWLRSISIATEARCPIGADRKLSFAWRVPLPPLATMPEVPKEFKRCPLVSPL
jgi:hypothetical protein